MKYILFLSVLIISHIFAANYKVVDLGESTAWKSKLLNNNNIIIHEDGRIYQWSPDKGKELIKAIPSTSEYYKAGYIPYVQYITESGAIVGDIVGDRINFRGQVEQDLFIYTEKGGFVNLQKEAQSVIDDDFQFHRDILAINEQGQLAGVVTGDYKLGSNEKNTGQLIFTYDPSSGFKLLKSKLANELPVSNITINNKGDVLLLSTIWSAYKYPYEIITADGKSTEDILDLNNYYQTKTGKDDYPFYYIFDIKLNDDRIIYGEVGFDYEPVFSPGAGYNLSSAVFAIYPNKNIYLSGITEQFEKNLPVTIPEKEDPPIYYSGLPQILHNNELIYFGSSINFLTWLDQYSWPIYKVDAERILIKEIETPKELIRKDEDGIFKKPNILAAQVNAQGNVTFFGRPYLNNYKAPISQHFLWDETKGTQQFSTLIDKEWGDKLIIRDDINAQMNEKGDILLSDINIKKVNKQHDVLLIKDKG